jgi:uncharacterized membrane protein
MTWNERLNQSIHKNLRPYNVISQRTANRMSAIALLLAAATIVLAGLKEFLGERGWIEFGLTLVVVALALPAQFAKLKRRSEKRRVIKSSRDSIEKHLWELRHHREW